MVTLADALAECLEVMRSGGDLGECLGRYPEHREELVMLMDVAQKIQPFPRLPNHRPSVAEVERLLRRLRSAERPQESEPRFSNSGGR